MHLIKVFYMHIIDLVQGSDGGRHNGAEASKQTDRAGTATHVTQPRKEMPERIRCNFTRVPHDTIRCDGGKNRCLSSSRPSPSGKLVISVRFWHCFHAFANASPSSRRFRHLLRLLTSSSTPSPFLNKSVILLVSAFQDSSARRMPFN